MQDTNPISMFMSRYIRGGCWYTKFAALMNRDYCGPGYEDSVMGFRVVLNHRKSVL